jgi:hypothetical protein
MDEDMLDGADLDLEDEEDNSCAKKEEEKHAI